MDILNAIKFFFLGVIEGITEWLPVSSTGHMLLFKGLWPPQGVSDGFWDLFLYAIQLGAILAVVVLFWKRMWPFAMPRRGGDSGGTLRSMVKVPVLKTWLMVIIACIPGIVAKFVADKKFDMDRLEIFPVIAFTLMFYGAVFIFLEIWNRGRQPKINDLSQITFKVALIIGLAQVLALVPGTSRSGMTIIAALLLGVSRVTAVEFSFFIAVPVMLGESALAALKLIKNGVSLSSAELLYLGIGMVVAFLVSMLVIRPILNFIKKHDFKPFGVYRILLGALIFALLALGVLAV